MSQVLAHYRENDLQANLFSDPDEKKLIAASERLRTWAGLVPDTARAELRVALVAQIAHSDAVLKKLSAKAVLELAQDIQVLGDLHPETVAWHWLTIGGSWTDAAPEELVGLLSRVNQVKAVLHLDTQPQFGPISSALQDKWLLNTSSIESLGVGRAIELWGRWLPEEQAPVTKHWASSILSLYQQGKAGLGSLTLAQTTDLANLLAAHLPSTDKALALTRMLADVRRQRVELVARGCFAMMQVQSAADRLDSAAEPAVALTWLDAGGDWQSSEPFEVLFMAQRLHESKSPATASWVSKLTTATEDRLVASSAFLGKLGVPPYCEMCRGWYELGTDEQRKRLVDGLAKYDVLLKAFVEDPSNLKGMTQGAVERFADNLTCLGRIKDKAAILHQWYLAGADWHGNPDEMLRLLANAGQNDAPEYRDAVQSIANYFYTQFISEKLYASGKELATVVQQAAWAKQASPEKRKLLLASLGQKINQGVIQVMNQDDDLYAWSDLYSALNASPEEWAAMTAVWCKHHEPLALKMPLDYFYYICHDEYIPFIKIAEQVKTNDQRMVMAGILKRALVDDKGQMNLCVNRAIASCYFASHHNQVWQEYVDDRLADGSLGPDERAKWLLARSYVEELKADPPAIGPLAGKVYLDRAFASADSEPVRLECLRWIVGRYCAIDQWDQAQALLTSCKGQFTNRESLDLIDQWSKELTEVAEKGRKRVALQAQQAQQGGTVSASQLQAQLDFLKKQLDELHTRHASADDVARLEAIIAQTRVSLASKTPH
jgi:hypothetical protein